MILLFCSYAPTVAILTAPLRDKYPAYDHAGTSTGHVVPRYVVVLGGGHSRDMAWPVSSRVGSDTMVRLLEGIRIYRLTPGSKLVLSGGTASGNVTSAREMFELATQLGVNEKDIIIESDSLDTDDQARIIKNMVGEGPFVLVTSDVHMPRSSGLFTKLGMKPIPAPTRSLEDKLYATSPNPFFPSAVNLQKAEMAFHEYLGIAWAKVRNQI